jgi:hypothetical protein
MREGEREEKEIEGCWCIFAQRKREEEEEEEEEDESHPVCYDMRDYGLLICDFFTDGFTDGKLNINIFNFFVCISVCNI